MTILDSAEVLLQAKNYGGSTEWLDESGNGHHAQFGTTAGADTNDPLPKTHSGGVAGNYVHFPGTAGNNLTVTLAVSTTFDYTITYEDDSTDTGEQTSTGGGVLTFGDTDVLFAGLDVKKIDVVPDGGGATLALFDASGAVYPFATFTDSIPEVWTVNRSAGALMTTLVDRAMFLLHTDDEFIIPDHANLDFADGEDFTIMTVARLNIIIGVFVDKSGGFGDTDTGYRLLIHFASVSPRLSISDGVNDADIIATGLPDLLVRDIFSAVGRRDDATPELEVFRNTTPTGSPNTQATADLSTALDLWLGNLNGGNNWINGQFIAFALWRSALTDAEIVEAHGLLVGVTELRGSIPIPGI